MALPSRYSGGYPAPRGLARYSQGIGAGIGSLAEALRAIQAMKFDYLVNKAKLDALRNQRAEEKAYAEARSEEEYYQALKLEGLKRGVTGKTSEELEEAIAEQSREETEFQRLLAAARYAPKPIEPQTQVLAPEAKFLERTPTGEWQEVARGLPRPSEPKPSELQPFHLTPKGTGLTLQFQDRAARFSADYETVRNNMLNIEASVDRMLESHDPSRIATDQAVITSFNKILDPTSVVRESEYARTPANAGLVDRAKGAMTKITKGGAGLTEKAIIEIRDTAREMAELRRTILNTKLEKQIRTPARLRGLDPEEIAPLYESLSAPEAVSVETPSVPTLSPSMPDTSAVDAYLRSIGIERP